MMKKNHNDVWAHLSREYLDVANPRFEIASCYFELLRSSHHGMPVRGATRHIKTEIGLLNATWPQPNAMSEEERLVDKRQT